MLNLKEAMPNGLLTLNYFLPVFFITFTTLSVILFSILSKLYIIKTASLPFYNKKKLINFSVETDFKKDFYIAHHFPMFSYLDFKN